MKLSLLLFAIFISALDSHGQSVLMTSRYQPGTHTKISYKFGFGKVKLPKRHFVDYPKANHSNLRHHYNRGGHMWVAFNGYGSHSSRRRK